MLTEFRDYMIENKLSENSYKSYLSDLKQYIKYYEDSYGEKLVQLISSDIQTYINYSKNRLNRKPSGINRMLTSLKTYNDFSAGETVDYKLIFPEREDVGEVFRKISEKPILIERIKYIFINKIGYAKTCVAITVLEELGLIANKNGVLSAVKGAPKTSLLNSPTYKTLTEKGC